MVVEFDNKCPREIRLNLQEIADQCAKGNYWNAINRTHELMQKVLRNFDSRLIGNHSRLAHNPKIDLNALSVRASNALRNANIVYIRELAEMRITKLLKLRNLGRKTVKELRAYLDDQGILYYF